MMQEFHGKVADVLNCDIVVKSHAITFTFGLIALFFSYG